MEQQVGAVTDGAAPLLVASLLAGAALILLLTFLRHGSSKHGRLPPSPMALPLIGHLAPPHPPSPAPRLRPHHRPLRAPRLPPPRPLHTLRRHRVRRRRARRAQVRGQHPGAPAHGRHAPPRLRVRGIRLRALRPALALHEAPLHVRAARPAHHRAAPPRPRRRAGRRHARCRGRRGQGGDHRHEPPAHPHGQQRHHEDGGHRAPRRDGRRGAGLRQAGGGAGRGVQHRGLRGAVPRMGPAGARPEDARRALQVRRAAGSHDQDQGEGAAGGARQGQEPKTKDLLDILMDAAADPAAEVKLTRDNIKAFVLDIFTAGSDTTATTVEWMMAELLNHPACLQKLREELDAVVGRDRLVSELDVANLPYLQAVLKETLRLRPPAVFAQREAIEPIHVRGYTIPVKTSVFFNIFSINRDGAWWEEPLEFRPDRFMPGGAGEAVDPKGQHLQLMPFGSGRRACPGMGLAMQAVPAFLAALVQCFDWEVPNPPLDMEEEAALVTSRKQHLVILPTQRLHPLPLP